MTKSLLCVTTSLFALLTACGQEATAPPSAGDASRSIYADAVRHSARTEADRARDAGRKPDEVLAFFGIEPGMTVLDMFSGGGYYTEILSRVVGPEGRVLAHTNNAYAQFVGEEATLRYADDRLPNVEILTAENNELRLAPDTFDAALMILAYHDIYYVDPQNGWPKIDGPGLVGEIYRGLRPGGILGIVDHYAAAGSPRETGNTLHRIDPEIVISELETAGFVLEAKSDALRNVDDDYSVNMAAPEVRGRTDRFVMRFRKPE
jgi:predicted methyltransferase